MERNIVASSATTAPTRMSGPIIGFVHDTVFARQSYSDQPERTNCSASPRACAYIGGGQRSLVLLLLGRPRRRHHSEGNENLGVFGGVFYSISHLLSTQSRER